MKNILRNLFFLILFCTAVFAQDSTKSKPFKRNLPNSFTPLFKPKYPSYPLIAGYVLQKDAHKGDPFAQHELGIRYLLGRGFPADTAKAIYWIKKAVDQNLTVAKFNYGILLYNGIGVKWNPFVSYEQFKFCAKVGLPASQYAYGLFFIDNLVVNKNLNEAYKWINKAALAGFDPAKETLKDLKKQGFQPSVDSMGTISEDSSAQIDSLYYMGSSTLMLQDWQPDFYDFSSDSIDTEKDDQMLTELLNKNTDELKNALGISKIKKSDNPEDSTGIGLIKYAANSGSPEALLITGRGYQKGLVLKKDRIRAAADYIRAYRLGSAKAGQYLFKMSRHNNFYDTLKKEIDNGNPEAMYVWAGLTALGFDYKLTEQQAFDLLQKAVAQNNIPSIIETGLCYYSGSLVNKNKEKAFEYWEKAANLGSREAKVRIAFTKISDDTTRTDLSESIEILKNASNEGSVLAQTALGYCYEHGKGVLQDKAQAAKYYRHAAQRGNETAYNSLKKMYDDIRPDDEEFQIYEE